MNTLSIARIAIGVVALWAVFSGETIIVVGAVILLALAFSAFESVAFALAFDLLWYAPETMHAWPWLTILTLALLWAAEPIRREILA